MSEIINIKDFYNHETRISLVEAAIINMDRRFEQIDKRFEQADKRLERLENRMDRMEDKIDRLLKWMLGTMGTGFVTIISLMAHGFHWGI